MNRWNPRDYPIRFKDLGFCTAEKLEKQIINNHFFLSSRRPSSLPATRAGSEEGGLFRRLSGPPLRPKCVVFIYFRGQITGYHQSFALITHTKMDNLR